jgi:hypothetical protein
MVGCLIATTDACASAGPRTLPDDRIIVPDDAVQVDHIDFFNPDHQVTHFNEHMVALWAGTRPYLLVFNERCPRLERTETSIRFRSADTTKLFARDVLVVNGGPCQIDSIYSITSEDVTALRKQLDL